MHTPLDIGYEKMCSNGKADPCYPDDRGGGHGMTGPVDGEDAVHLHLRFTLWGHATSHLSGREDDLGVTVTFEDLSVHPVIARAVAALATGRIDDTLAID